MIPEKSKHSEGLENSIKQSLMYLYDAIYKH